MSVKWFIHLNSEGNYDFDIVKFNKEIELRFPEVKIEMSDDNNLNYDISWEYYSNLYQFEFKMDKKRCTFVVYYFNSSNRLNDFAEFILWLRKFFPSDKEVILCDENYTDSRLISDSASIIDSLKKN